MSRHTLKTFALLGLTLLLVAACGDAGATASVSPTPHPPLVPATPGADPFSLLAWLFTPVFQALFIGLVLLDRLTGDVGISILILTLIIRVILISPYRKQLVSQKRTQLLAPEVAEIQRRYKGDKVKIQQAQMELYRSRGVSPFGGCLPTLLQFIVLIPMYTVISNGLTNPDPTAMLSVFGFNVGEAVGLVCANGLGTAAYDNMKPCIEATVPWLGGLNASLPSVIDVAGFGVSTSRCRQRTSPGDSDTHGDQSKCVEERPNVRCPGSDHGAPATYLGTVRRDSSRRPVHLLDLVHAVLDRSAVLDPRLRWALPALRLDARLCR